MLPGISGSTVALILGVFDKLINEIDNFFDTIFDLRKVVVRKLSARDWVRSINRIDIRFMATVGGGAILAFLLMSNLIVYLFDNYPHFIVAILLGLVISTLIIPFSQIERKAKYYLVAFLVAAGLFWVLGHDITGEPGNVNVLYLFAAGFLAGVMMPGLNGSFILLIMGVYYYAVNLVKRFFDLDLDTIWFIHSFAFASGLVTGFVTTAQVLQIALRKYRSVVMAVIAGLLLGSLRILWPFVEAIHINEEPVLKIVPISEFNGTETTTIILLFLAVAITMTLLNITRAKKGAFSGEDI